MSAINGNNRILYIRQGANFVPIACLTNNSFTESSSTFSITTRLDGGWIKEVPDQQSYSLSFDGINQDTGLSYLDLQTLKREQILIEWGIGSEGNVNESGKGYITDLSSTDPTNNNSTFNGTINGYGKPESGGSAIGVNTEDFLTDGDDNLIQN